MQLPFWWRVGLVAILFDILTILSTFHCAFGREEA